MRKMKRLLLTVVLVLAMLCMNLTAVMAESGESSVAESGESVEVQAAETEEKEADGQKEEDNEEDAESQTETSKEEEWDIQYVMYLGTNDKDTNSPRYTEDQAREVLKKILLDHFGGYTIQEASGGWVDDGKVYQEYTLVIYLSDTTEEAVHAAADELIEAFNQSSILIQANRTKTEFYS